MVVVRTIGIPHRIPLFGAVPATGLQKQSLTLALPDGGCRVSIRPVPVPLHGMALQFTRLQPIGAPMVTSGQSHLPALVFGRLPAIATAAVGHSTTWVPTAAIGLPRPSAAPDMTCTSALAAWAHRATAIGRTGSRSGVSRNKTGVLCSVFDYLIIISPHLKRGDFLPPLGGRKKQTTPG